MTHTIGQRFGSRVGLRPEKREEYLALHREVWPDVLAKLTEVGIRNYTIFLQGDELFGYYEFVGDDHAAAQAALAADPRTQEWWRLTDPCQQRLPGTPEGAQWQELTEVFHLD